jgi:hypothetical protein
MNEIGSLTFLAFSHTFVSISKFSHSFHHDERFLFKDALAFDLIFRNILIQERGEQTGMFGD